MKTNWNAQNNHWGKSQSGLNFGVRIVITAGWTHFQSTDHFVIDIALNI